MTFRGQHGATDCYDITEIDDSSTKLEMVTYFLLKGGVVRCFAGAARYASAAKEAIDAVLATPPGDRASGAGELRGAPGQADGMEPPACTRSWSRASPAASAWAGAAAGAGGGPSGSTG